MNVVIPEEEMRLTETEVMYLHNEVGLRIQGVSEITLWFESKAALELWLENTLWKVQGRGT